MKESRIIEHEYKENCFILTSFHTKKYEGTDMKSVYPTVSFLYRGETKAAEWEVQYGPIQLWEKADENIEDAKEHYVYPLIHDIPANWSQLAVEDNDLQGALLRGNYDYIFDVLERWAER